MKCALRKWRPSDAKDLAAALGSIRAFRQGNIHRQTAELGYYLAEEY